MRQPFPILFGFLPVGLSVPQVLFGSAVVVGRVADAATRGLLVGRGGAFMADGGPLVPCHGPAERCLGTFAGVVPVRSVDGRTIGTGHRGPMVERLQGLYADLVAADVAARSAS